MMKSSNLKKNSYTKTGGSGLHEQALINIIIILFTILVVGIIIVVVFEELRYEKEGKEQTAEFCSDFSLREREMFFHHQAVCNDDLKDILHGLGSICDELREGIGK